MNQPHSLPSTSQQNICYCGVPESFFRRGSAMRRWGKRHLLWMIVDYIPTIEKVVQTSIYASAFREWSNVCGLTFEQTTQDVLADFLILTKPIDGAGGTLAQHELPYGNDVQLRGWFDVGDKWTVSGPISQAAIDLKAVATHEFGHGIGLGHLKTPGSLMNPIYDPAIRSPQDADIEEAVLRYGDAIEPRPDPPSVPSPESPPCDVDYPVGGMIEMASGAKYPMLVQNNGKWGGE